MSFAVYDQRPWLARYSSGLPGSITPGCNSVLQSFSSLVQHMPDAPAIRYFDGVISYRELDAASSALAVALMDKGFARGDRLGLFMQNNPAFVIGLLAAWKLGGVAIAINPMNKAAELGYIFTDSGARAILCLDTLYADAVAPAIAQCGGAPNIVVTCSAHDNQTMNDTRVLGGDSRVPVPHGVLDLDQIIHSGPGIGTGHERASWEPPRPDDVALLTYTSGTTGKPKGAMNTHGNLVFNACVFRDWTGLRASDGNICMAPVFHITGLVAHVATGLLVGCPLILTHRFHPDVFLEAVRRERPAFTIGAITAFISLMNAGSIQAGDFDSFRAIYSGGAPVSPAIVDAFQSLTGHYIHNAYGMTETASATLIVPQGSRAPVDESSGALSIGVPVFNTVIRVVREDGTAADPNEVGELMASGPQLMKGYWNRPRETAEAVENGFLRTGDVGFMDKAGWFYLVDRKKDMINAGGYKVWPREVEDVLYSHSAVREAAVIGIPDDYRGETIKAIVSLKEGASATAQDLIAYCRERMSAYKCPRIVAFMDDLPKTNTGKILRRSLRQ
jgi:long-chain acyl-CoA synthetase